MSRRSNRYNQNVQNLVKGGCLTLKKKGERIKKPRRKVAEKPVSTRTPVDLKTRMEIARKNRQIQIQKKAIKRERQRRAMLSRWSEIKAQNLKRNIDLLQQALRDSDKLHQELEQKSKEKDSGINRVISRLNALIDIKSESSE
ncbi:unnamed protein product [Bursaphelenchus xylophilus]|uniref:(pine wood nematode) hypothetical protein n=1 Tax=Bursaphelenchus xylophilus TaxID=6326 RepID=A0A1I7SE24_BURXY|nr:unnamed protein product [Bursaphelenchus xylophilus]CAG9113155.1 unnamed protein product [Bursaphelenchus xylophilus]